MIFPASGDVWNRSKGVGRVLAANPWVAFYTNGAGTGNYDDIALVPANPVTLTVTPQSTANSTSGDTLLVNGRDLASQALTGVSANYGDVRFSITPNHNDSDVALFGTTTPYECLVWGDANNNIAVFWSAADSLRVTMTIGGVPSLSTWATGGGAIVAGTTYQARVLWTATQTRLYIDGVLRATVAAATGFATVPTVVYYGSDQLATNHNDVIYSPY